MKTNACRASTCSNCRFFQPEGLHQGNCDRLHITVGGQWPTCHLGLPAFDSIEELLGRADSALDQPNRVAAKV